MIAADKEDRIKALVLVATAGTSGAELNLAQVERAMARANRPPAEREATLALQKRIHEAVLKGTGWEEVPPGFRQQADSPWFQSFLTFDPARAIRGVDQPLLIVQPMLDVQVAPGNADRLEALARARRRKAPVEVVRLPGLNHLLVPSTTGEIDERSAAGAQVSPVVATTVGQWLTNALATPS
jgi:hypothetical protein